MKITVNYTSGDRWVVDDTPLVGIEGPFFVLEHDGETHYLSAYAVESITIRHAAQECGGSG